MLTTLAQLQTLLQNSIVFPDMFQLQVSGLQILLKIWNNLMALDVVAEQDVLKFLHPRWTKQVPLYTVYTTHTHPSDSYWRSSSQLKYIEVHNSMPFL